MTSSAAQIKSFKVKGISTEEKSVPWSQQVDEASNELFVPLESNVQKNYSASDQNQKSAWESGSKFNRNIKNRDFYQVDYNKPSYQVNQRIKQENQFRSSNKISTKKDSELVIHRPMLTSHYSISDKTNETMESKKTTWASIASQPIKSVYKGSTTMANHKKKGPGMPPPPMVPGKHNLDIASWELPKSNTLSVESSGVEKDLVEKTIENFSNFSVDSAKHEHKLHKEEHNNYSERGVDTNNKRSFNSNQSYPEKFSHSNEMKNVNYNQKMDGSCFAGDASEIIGERTGNNYPLPMNEFKHKNNYNPPQLSLEMAALARFFVIKSYSEDDIHRSIKYEIWCSTDHGNKRLDDAFRERLKKGGSVLLFFSVNGSGHFCGMAQMMTPVDYNTTASVWSQDKWKGKFKVKWIYVKDVPNGQLRHIKLENNENKSVTNSRDTQEVPNAKGIQVLKIIHSYKHQTSIFDDFYHYEKKQEEEISKKPSDYSATKHSTQNKVFYDYYKNKNPTERHDFHGDYHSGHKKNSGSGERDKAFNPEYAFNRESKNNMNRYNDFHHADKIIK